MTNIKKLEQLYDVIDDEDNIILSGVTFNEAQSETDCYGRDEDDQLYIVEHVIEETENQPKKQIEDLNLFKTSNDCSGWFENEEKVTVMYHITELARSMKAASEKAKHAGEAPIMPFDVRVSALNEYQLTVCPDNVIALVEALEKAQQRIAELESRTVNIKFVPIQVEELGNVRDGKKHPYMFGAGYNSAVIHCESVIQQELDAQGIKWEAE